MRAVRGGQSGPLDNLVINGDGTVTDTSTGLMWQQQTAGPMTWEEAISYCEGLSLGGYNDWRLPNRNELQSLVDYTRYCPAIDTTVFPGTMSSNYWSSTTCAYYTSYAWCVGFHDGFVYYDGKSSSYYVRAVRGGQSGPLDNSVIVAGHTPSDGVCEVAVDTVVTVSFNKSMDRTSAEAAFSLTPSVSGGITWADDDKTLIFTPAASLSPGVKYTVSIASSATDTEGHKLDSNENGTGGEPGDTYTFTFTTEDTTLIELDQFTTVSQRKLIAITWITLGEIDNAGFNLWRSEAKDGEYIKVNPGIIEAKGGATLDAEYSYADTAVKPGITYYYKLEDIDTKGVSTFHGPISACVLVPVPIPFPFLNPVPDTGQTQSYTDIFGEDSDYTINPPSYTKLDAQGNALPDSDSSWSMVKDNVTGLMWEMKTDDGSIHDKDNTYNWGDAQSVFIAKLNATNYGGFSDWRLPTFKELSSIVNSGN